jgi:Protein of unknown function (DUF2911)
MSTRLPRFSLVVIVLSVLATAVSAQTATPPKIDFPAASPAGMVKQRIGLTDIEVSYSRPGMKGRTIFGGLVPFDQVWRTGANTATTISFSTAVKLNGTSVAAGTYELFTIPGKLEWTVIIHKNASEWGTYSYDAKNDIARIKTVPVALPYPVETFAISFNDLRDESGVLYFTWENTRVPVKIEVEVTAALVPQIEAVMASSAAKKPYAQAAMFYLDHGLDLKKAATWMDAAIASQPDAFYLVYRKALILEKIGDKAGAIATATASLEAASKDKGAIKDEYVGLNQALLARLR